MDEGKEKRAKGRRKGKKELDSEEKGERRSVENVNI